MRLLQRITNTCMSRRKNPLPLPQHLRPIKLHLHQLVHIMPHQHIAIQLYHALILHQTKRRELRPAVVEARVGAVVFAILGQQVCDFLRGDTACFEDRMAFGGKGVGVECDEGVFRVVRFEAVVEGEEAGEIFRVGYEGCPNCFG